MATLEEIFDDANSDLAVGELESAVEKYRQCVELDPAFFDGWHALGMALMKVGRFPEAIEPKRSSSSAEHQLAGRACLSSTIATATSRKRSRRHQSEDPLLGGKIRRNEMWEGHQTPRCSRNRRLGRYHINLTMHALSGRATIESRPADKAF